MIQFLAGLIASMLHVVTGPDHIAAVTPIAIDSKSDSWKVGFFWGIGHTLGVLIIGALFVLFREFIPINLISEYSEQLVGIVLIIIGIWAFTGINNTNNQQNKKENKSVSLKSITALSVGIIHGLAGVSHLIGLLPALAFPSRIEAILYLSGFGFGAILAMTIFSALLGYLSIKLTSTNKNILNNVLKAFGGSLAIVIGLLWIFKTF